jgi:hypothetical protein
LAPSIGFGSYVANIGTVENKGFELRTKLVCINNTSSNVYLAVWGRLAHNDNEITKISDNLKEQNEMVLRAIEEEMEKNKGKSVGSDNIGQKSLKPISQFEEGGSIYDIRAVRSMGIDPSNGKEIYQALDGTYTYDWNPRDQVVVGSVEADIQGNFGFDARYKNFSLNASFYYRYGGQVFNQTLLNKVENANPYYNVDKRVLTERWKKPGDIAKFKDITDMDITNMSSRFVEDDNLLSLQRVSLGYDFNKEFISRLGLNSLKMSLYMADIVQFSSVKMERGINYPFARSVSFSLKCNF